MPLYQCKVINDLGKKATVFRQASDEVSLKAYLKMDNFVLLSAELVTEKEPNMLFAVSSKAKKKEVIAFFRQFAVMIKAGIPISDSLNVLKNQNCSKAFHKVLIEVHNDILSGILLSEAFKKHPKVFPEFFVEMVAIGEVSGSLDNVLSSMADYYENDEKIRRKVKSAMIYPSILLVLIVVVIVFMAVVILPEFQRMIADMGGEDIPVVTQVIFKISNFIKDYFIFILLGIIAVAFLIFLFFRTKSGRRIKDNLKIHFPLIGKVNRNVITARFTRAFVILLSSGMTVTDCMENLDRMLGNQIYIDKFKFSIDEVKRGKRIAKSIENTELFPPMLTEMINVGERSGNLEEVLTSTSAYFDNMVESSIAKATAALEPIMIILLGVIVGVVILSVYLPIISMMQNIN